MAIQTSRKPRTPAAAPAEPVAQVDALRAAAGPQSDIIPPWILILIFVVVEVLVVWLMLPQFKREFTAWLDNFT